MKTYLITQDELKQLADAICLLDWIKNTLPDASPEKADAAAKSIRCHGLIAGVLGDDDALVYAADQQEITA